MLLGNGDGSFQVPRTFAVGVSPRSVVVGDFNGDGLPDLAVANSGSDNVSLLLGNGDGSFRATRELAAGIAPWAVAVSDFNADGVQDLAVTNLGRYTGDPGTVSVLLGNGDGTFQAARNFATGRGPWSITVGDFNGDGLPDLAVADWYATNVAVLLGNGDGSFQAAQYFGAGINPASVAVSDFNGDGKADLAVANAGYVSIERGNVSVLINNTPSIGRPR